MKNKKNEIRSEQLILSIFMQSSMRNFTPNNIIEYVEKVLLKKLEILDYPETIKNPYSGKKCLLNPVQVALYDFIIGAEMTLNELYSPIVMMKYTFAKDYFRLKWPNEFQILLD